jgi:NodT family efflux transporter outer membrane factor (OMF) lipoprotein
MIRTALLPTLAAVIALAGCVAGPDYAAPVSPAPQAYGGALEREASVSAGPAWWTGFDDPALTGLIEAALADNLEIAQGARRLAAAQALSGAARSDFLPTLDGGATYTLTSSGADAASVGVSFGQIIDVNGRLQRAEERARAELLAARYDLDDVRRLTAASAASLYVQLRRARARLALLDASLELQQRTLDIVEQRAQAGLSADLDVRRARADLARTRAQRGALELQQARARNALAVLIGRAPGQPLDALNGVEINDPDAPGLSYAAPIALGAPADLLRRRPDLRAAEARLMAATAQIGVQEADLYPSLRLPGSISANLAGGGDDLTGALSAVLDIPLLDFGRRRAEVTAAEADAAEAALGYQQAVLGALNEVETGIVAIQSVEARLADLGIAVDESERGFDQLNALYREGLASFIDVLDAQRTLIGSRESLVDSQADLAAAIIDLNVALASPVPDRAAPTGA